MGNGRGIRVKARGDSLVIGLDTKNDKIRAPDLYELFDLGVS